MMLKCILCVALSLAMTLMSIHCLYEGDVCSGEGQSGTCRLLSKCTVLQDEIKKVGTPLPISMRRKLQSLTCGFDYDEPIICCIEHIVPPVVETTPSTPSQETSKTQTPNVFSRTNKSPPDVHNHRNIDLLPTNCGVIDDDKIFGGTKSKMFEMPWMVLISFNTDRGINYGCGGSLINERYVLTAGHCITLLKPRQKLAGVIIGEYDVRTDADCERVEDQVLCAPNVQNISIASAIAHPGYDPQSLYDDIGLIRLSRPVNFSSGIKAICLPTTTELQTETLLGVDATVAGWGATEDTLPSPVLLHVDVPIVNNTICEKRYKTILKIHQICAGGVEGKDSCKGDSGSPLIYSGKVGSLGVRSVQRGIVSYGLRRRCGAGGTPGVYTNVAFYMDWILDTMFE